ncbi:hypothetical protein LZP73_13265 [Shewanella sp. AS16]|uniref:hypothetical protein n=1 Tax=Shewanella sp. AS16 TaxID=2907625 RepID=UPI001F1AD334|nr:hypothetical protein [Shewanella sp. AS16]MCE9687162.1 hypothetical protein [Shewanella sp. AS16]
MKMTAVSVPTLLACLLIERYFGKFGGEGGFFTSIEYSFKLHGYLNIMNRFFIFCSSFLLVLCSNSTVAGGGLPANKIDAVAFQTGGFFLYAKNWPNPNGCSRSDAVVLLDSDKNYDKAYSLVLMAYAAGKSVSGYSDGCIEFDEQTYNTIRGFKYLQVR